MALKNTTRMLVFATFLSTFLISALSACTRGSSNNARVTIGLPTFSGQGKVGSLSYEPRILIVNIHAGNGQPPIKKEWSARNCGPGAACVAPASFVFENIPQGSNQIIQALFVLEDENGRMEFRYGDVVQNILAGDNLADITVTPIGSSNTQGVISGRYIDTALFPNGATGRLEQRFQPPNNRPEMLISEGAVFAGWFNGFILDGQNGFNFYFDERRVFSNLTLTSPEVSVSSNPLNRIRVNIPAHFRNYNDENNVSVFRYEPESKAIIGYFGPGSTISIYRACYKNATENISGTSLIASATPLMQWIPGATGTSAVSRAGGGVADTVTECSDANLFVSALKFRHETINNGRDSIAGFRGPFKGTINNGYLNFTTTSRNGANDLAITFSMLPQTTIGVSGLDGVTLFYNQSANDDDEIYGDSGIMCSRLEAFGYSEGPSLVFPSGEAASYSLTMPNAPVNASFVLCPYRVKPGFAGIGNVKIFFDGGLEVWEHNTSTGPSATQSNQLEFLIASQTSPPQSFRKGSIAPETVAKANFLDAESHVYFKTNTGQFILVNDVDKLFYSVTGTASYTELTTPLDAINQLFVVDPQNTQLIGILNNSATDQTLDLMIRFKATEHEKYGLPIDYQLPSINLVGTDTCSSLGDLILVDQVGDPLISPTDLGSPIDTDQERTIKFGWSSCAQATAIIKSADLTGIDADPMNCFGNQDIGLEGASLIKISPRDIAGDNCLLTTAHLAVATFDASASPNFLGLDLENIDFEHSIVPFGLGMLADFSGTFTPSNRILYRSAVLGPDQQLKVTAINLNSDLQVTNYDSTQIASPTWSFTNPGPAFSWSNWFLGALDTASYSILSLRAKVTGLVAGGVKAISASDSGKMGQLPIYVNPNSFMTLDTTSDSFNGGSPLSLFIETSEIKLSYFPFSGNGIPGSPIIMQIGTSAFPTASGLEYAKLNKFNYAMKTYILVTLQYSTNQIKLYLGVVNNMNGEIIWKDTGPFNISGTKAKGVFVNDQGKVMILTKNAGDTIRELKYLTPPRYGSSSWTSNWVEETASSLNSRFDEDIFDLVECEGTPFVVGRSATNQLVAQGYYASTIISESGSPLVSATNIPIGTSVKGSCAPLRPTDINDSSAVRVFFLHRGNSMAEIHAFNAPASTSNMCGATALASLPIRIGGTLTRDFTLAGGEVFSAAMAIKDKSRVQSVLAIHSQASGPQEAKISRFNFTCNGSNEIEMPGLPELVGKMFLKQPMVKGMKVRSDYGVNPFSPTDQIQVFGQDFIHSFYLKF